MAENTNQDLPNESSNFFNYVFNFNDENKNELLNLIQYAILAIIPIVIILKSVKTIFPEDDDNKGTVEILAESVGQIIFLIITIWLSDRVIKYIPTYTETNYSQFNFMHSLIPFMVIILTMQSKLGSKINILTERLCDYINGNEKPPANKSNVKVSQPLTNKNPIMHQPSQADYLDQSQLLPSNPQLTSMPQQQQPQQQMAPPVFNEPMAANDNMGGFASW
tara:strand:- start:494 stop:1156 length:663 start_codon:yes stop_codon:yes gene_type:complete